VKLTSIVPMLATTDIPETVRFYQERLGFECKSQMEGWACLERDGVELMLSAPNAHLPFEKPLLTGSLYFRLSHADEVDELWAKVRGETPAVYPIEDFEYGMREFAIRDNNGYILQFGAEIGE
jgi:uncharacterized glyoxalase superfamily protein PhnB